MYIRDTKIKGVQFKMGQVDYLDQLLMLGLHFGFVQHRGSIFEYGEIMGKGRNDFKAQLDDYAAEKEQLEEDIIEEAWSRKGL